MSATGQGGVTIIAGRNHSTLNPVTLPASYEIIFAHNVGRRAFSVIVTSGDVASFGQVLTGNDGIYIYQPDVNTIRVSSTGLNPRQVFVSCRWEEPTPELDLVNYEEQGAQNDPRISIVEVPR